jgi:hypothetical protein
LSSIASSARIRSRITVCPLAGACGLEIRSHAAEDEIGADPDRIGLEPRLDRAVEIFHLVTGARRLVDEVDPAVADLGRGNGQQEASAERRSTAGCTASPARAPGSGSRPDVRPRARRGVEPSRGVLDQGQLGPIQDQPGDADFAAQQWAEGNAEIHALEGEERRFRTGGLPHRDLGQRHRQSAPPEPKSSGLDGQIEAGGLLDSPDHLRRNATRGKDDAEDDDQGDGEEQD